MGAACGGGCCCDDGDGPAVKAYVRRQGRHRLAAGNCSGLDFPVATLSVMSGVDISDGCATHGCVRGSCVNDDFVAGAGNLSARKSCVNQAL